MATARAASSTLSAAVGPTTPASTSRRGTAQIRKASDQREGRDPAEEPEDERLAVRAATLGGRFHARPL